MLKPGDLEKVVLMEEHPLLANISRAMLLSPFIVKWLFGFEWAVLVSLLVGTYYIASLLRGVITDTTSLNLMKQHEHKLWLADD